MRVAAIFLVALVLIPVISVSVLHIPSVQKAIIAYTTEKIESITNYKVELESYKWWSFSRISLFKIKVESNGKQVANCNKLTLCYYLSTDWPYVIPEEVYLENPFLRLEKTPDGKWLKPGKAMQRVEEFGFDDFMRRIPLPRLRISSGSIEGRYQNELVARIRNFSGVFRLKLAPGKEQAEIVIDFESSLPKFSLPERSPT